MHGDVVNAVADFGVGIGNELRNQALVDRFPGFAGVVGAECTGGGNGDVDAIGVLLVENDGVETHSAAAGGFEKSSVFHARINNVWIGMRRLEMPDALEFPGMLGAVVELVGGERR